VATVVRVCLAYGLLVVLTCVPAPAAGPADPNRAVAKQLNAVIEGSEYAYAGWGALVVNAKTGDVVYERNAETMYAPASVTKLFSCAAALIALGPDSTTETAVYQRGLAINGVLRGDLILVAAGDLSFGSRTKNGKTVFKDKDHTYANSGLGEAELTDTDPLLAFDSLAKQIKDAKITSVEGEVLVDDRLFARARGSGSGPDAVSPMIVNDNAIDVLVEPGEKPGDDAKVTTRPKSAFYQVDTEVTTLPEKSGTAVQLVPISPNQFAVRGQISIGAKPHVKIYPVDDPASFARALFIEALKRAGVKVSAVVFRPGPSNLPPKDAYAKLTKAAAFTSPPLKEAITVTLKVSHNLYASTLPSLVAVSCGFSTPEAGLREQRKILKDLGVDVNQVSFGSGAGGSNADYVTPRATVQLLQGMSKRPEWEAYKAGLPVLGVDGTLADTVPATSPAKGKVFAKTGTLVWFDACNDRYLLRSKALAGTMTTQSGTPLFFAFYVNNVSLPDGVGVTREGQALGKLCEILYRAGP
jgi:D-alanyl-D-alanine carboxypeptidase/D-alanyl-D-alanine-endopeptidase (penicillin-binding protein 4)